MGPKDRLLRAVTRCLRTFPNVEVIVDTTCPDHSIYTNEDNPIWKDLYLDVLEDISKYLPVLKDPRAG